MPKHQLIKKKKVDAPRMNFNEIKNIEADFKDELETNPLFSLEIDPLNQYNFDEQEEEFIEQMIQYKNIRFVATVLMNIEMEDALSMYKRYDIQEEIKRITRAMYARRFCSKMADLDALGGYLTTAITDENVSVADRLTGKEKLAAVRLLIELNELKAQMYENPEVIDVVAIEQDIKNLKVDDIKMLIENSNEDDKIIEEKNELIARIDKEGLLSPEEVTYLRTLPNSELKKLAKEIEGGLKKIDENED